MITYPPLNDYKKWLDLSLIQEDTGKVFFSEIAFALNWSGHINAAPGNPREMLIELGVEAGDYVVVPNLCPTYWATAATGIGADCILIDNHPDHWQLDLDLLEEFLMNFSMLDERDELILKKDSRIIRAVIVPHLLGGMCDMERLAFIAKRFHLPLAEDITQALGSSWNGKSAGSFGSLNYCNFIENPVLPFGQSVVFSDDESLLNNLGPTNEWIPPVYSLANQLGQQLVPKLNDIIAAFRKLEAYYRHSIQEHQLKWMSLPDTNLSNGLSSALLTEKKLPEERIPFGRLRLPLYRRKPFNKSLYIRREDWSGKLYDNGLVLPIGFEMEPIFERVIQLLNEIDD